MLGYMCKQLLDSESYPVCSNNQCSHFMLFNTIIHRGIFKIAGDRHGQRRRKRTWNCLYFHLYSKEYVWVSSLLVKKFEVKWISVNEKTTSGLSNYLKVLSKAFSVFTLLLSSFSHALLPLFPSHSHLAIVVREWRTKPRPPQSITKQHHQSTRGAQVSSGDWRVRDWWGRFLYLCMLMQHSVSLFKIEYRRFNRILFVSYTFSFVQFSNINLKSIKRTTCVCVWRYVHTHMLQVVTKPPRHWQIFVFIDTLYPGTIFFALATVNTHKHTQTQAKLNHTLA